MLAVFVGNLTIKPATTPLIRSLGFKRLLLINGALNVLALLACAFLTPQTPAWLVMLILYLGGVFRSISVYSHQYAGFCGCAISADELYANTLFSTATQLAVGLGITLGAIGIRIGGKSPVRQMGIAGMPGMSFRLAFVAIALICLVGMVDTLRLTKDAGSAVSSKKVTLSAGQATHRPAKRNQPTIPRTKASISLSWQFSKKHCWKRWPDTAVLTSSGSIARRGIQIVFFHHRRFHLVQDPGVTHLRLFTLWWISLRHCVR